MMEMLRQKVASIGPALGETVGSWTARSHDAHAAPSTGPAASSSQCQMAGSSNQPLDDAFHSRTTLPTPSTSARSPRLTTAKWNLRFPLPAVPPPGSSFRPVPRISASLPPSELLDAIGEYEDKGVPVAIEGFHELAGWRGEMFTPEWLLENTDGSEEVSARNVHTLEDRQMPLEDLISHCRSAGPFTQPGETERFYGKDGKCPPQWEDWLRSGGVVPEKILPFGSGDVFRHVQPNKRVETLMTYMGVGDTYTPCHKDLCASIGQNVMVYTESNGSAIWFMTAREDSAAASAYFQNLKQELDLETHVAKLEELKKAPFAVYVHEQKLGDMVCVPQRCCHQVVNQGGITIKLSWSRMSMSSLELAFKAELPIYHRVCRVETYKVKLVIHSTLKALTEEVVAANLAAKTIMYPTASDGPDPAELDRLVREVEDLLPIYEEIIVAEWDPSHRGEPAELDDYKLLTHISCDFCGADVFQSFFECKKCANPDEGIDSFVVCSGCYVEGRSCTHEVMSPSQLMPFETLLETRNAAARAVNDYKRSSGPIPMWTKVTVASRGHPHIHEAACIFRDQLARAKQARLEPEVKCREAGTHLVPRTWSIVCRGCHKQTCFLHTLTKRNCHSAVAFLCWAGDTTGDAWHKLHQAIRAAYDDSMRAVEQGSAKVEYLDGRQRLAYAAKTYKRCRPADVRAKLGFYDEHFDNPAIRGTSLESPVKATTAGKKREREDGSSEIDELDTESPVRVRSQSVQNPARKPKKPRLSSQRASALPVPLPAAMAQDAADEHEVDRAVRGSQLPDGDDPLLLGHSSSFDASGRMNFINADDPLWLAASGSSRSATRPDLDRPSHRFEPNGLLSMPPIEVLADGDDDDYGGAFDVAEPAPPPAPFAAVAHQQTLGSDAVAEALVRMTKEMKEMRRQNEQALQAQKAAFDACIAELKADHQTYKEYTSQQVLDLQARAHRAEAMVDGYMKSGADLARLLQPVAGASLPAIPPAAPLRYPDFTSQTSAPSAPPAPPARPTAGTQQTIGPPSAPRGHRPRAVQGSVISAITGTQHRNSQSRSHGPASNSTGPSQH